MQLLKIYSENLYSFLKLDLDLTKYANGTTIILGKNLDMDSSNGAGKSNILKIIYFALWGSDHESIPLENLIHDQSDGSFFLYLDFSDGKDLFRIIRYHNYKGNAPIDLPEGKKIKGKGTVLLINGEEPFASAEAGKTSVQSLITNKLGMSPDIFLNSVFTPQKRKKPFLEASDSDKKEVLSEILDLNYFDQAAKLLDDDIKSKNELLKNYDRKIELNTQKKEDLKKNLKDLETNINLINKEYIAKKDELKNQISTLRSEILILKNTIETTNVVDTSLIQKELQEIKIKIQNSENNLKEKDKVITLKGKLQGELDNFEKNQAQIKNDINQSILDIELIQKEINSINKEEIKDYSKEINEKQSQLIIKKDKENEFKKIIENLNLIKQDLNKVDLLLDRNNNDQSLIKKEIENIIKENACQTCLRSFKEGESSVLDQLLLNKKNELVILESKYTDFKSKKELFIKKEEHFTKQKTIIEQELSLLLPIEKELQNLLVLDEKNKNLLEKLNSLKQRILNIQNTKTKKENDLLILQKNNDNNQKQLNEIIPILNLLSKEDIKLKDLRTLLEKLQKDLSEQELSNQKLSSLIEARSNKEALLKGIDSRINELETNKKNYQDLFNRQKEELFQCDQIENDLISKSTEQKEELKYLLFWEKGFSKTGIRSFIIDDVIEFLNQRVKDNLEVLSNGTTSLFFESENKRKTTGVVTNNISTKFFINGRERLLKLHSGGEAERCTIAVDLALSDLAESRSGTKFNIRFLDEPFTAFDTKPQLKSFALFNKAAEEKQGFFIISHNKEFQQYCDNTIYVVKQDGVSKIVDHATFINMGENNG